MSLIVQGCASESMSHQKEMIEAVLDNQNNSTHFRVSSNDCALSPAEHDQRFESYQQQICIHLPHIYLFPSNVQQSNKVKLWRDSVGRRERGHYRY